jgi:succinoglycan biosynthesis transport protein ExoP
MSTAMDHTVDLRHYARLLWRRKWLVVLCTVATVCATVIGLTFIPKQYQSSATLLIEDRKPLAREVEQAMGGLGGRNTDYRADEERTARIIGYVRSRPFLERVVKVLKMNEDPHILAEAKARQAGNTDLTVDDVAVRLLVSSLKSRIQVGTGGPGLYRFTVRDFSPRNAQLLAKWISELFIDMTTKQELERIRAARNFGNEQLRIYQDQLKRSEDALERYQSGLIQEQLASKLVKTSNLSVAEGIQKRLADDAATARARVGPFSRSVLDHGLSLDAGPIRQDSDVQALVDKLQNALQRSVEEELSAGSSAISVGNARTVMASARTQLYQEIERKAAELHPEASQDAVRALATYVFSDLDATIQQNAAADLQRSIDAVTRSARSTPASSLELTRLQNEVDRNRQLLESFKSQLTATDISQAVETTDLGLRIDIVDPAQYPLEPSWPDSRKILILSLLMGPILGVGFAFLSEVLDPTLRTLTDIQRVAPEPVLGTLPLLDDVVPRPTGFRRYWIPVTLIGVVLVTTAFFVARATVLPNLGPSVTPVKTVEPAEGAVR